MTNKIIFFTLSVLLLSACNQDDKINAIKETHNHGSSREYTSNVVGKPRAPITMRYEYLNQPALNEITAIRLNFIVQRASETLQIQYKTAAHLKSVDASQQFTFNQLEKGEETSLQIQVIAEKTGLSYINVFATISIDGKRQSRSFAIPLEIKDSTGANAKQKAQSDSKPQLNSGQNVISMPAVESNKMPVTPDR